MTKKMPALFAKNPPRRPLTSLEALVDDWVYRFSHGGVEAHRRDMVVEYCAKAPDLLEAIRRACDSKNEEGKQHNHQSRVPHAVRAAFAARIEPHQAERIQTFDALYDYLDYVKPSGIGPVTLYDVATRIAAFLELPVESLYLHAGVRVGWAALHGKRSPNVLRIPREQIPKELLRLPTDEVEDFLCCYREFFKPWLKDEKCNDQTSMERPKI
jgi:hypothetical protein